MKTRTIFLALCILFTGCVGGCKSCECPSGDCDKPIPKPENRYGCKARIVTRWGNEKNVEYSFCLDETEDDAKAYARSLYQMKYPNVEPTVNCWDCSKSVLDKKARETCNVSAE